MAQATIDSRLARKKDPKTVLNIAVPNGSKPNLMLILQRTFSDRVTIWASTKHSSSKATESSSAKAGPWSSGS